MTELKVTYAEHFANAQVTASEAKVLNTINDLIETLKVEGDMPLGRPFYTSMMTKVKDQSLQASNFLFHLPISHKLYKQEELSPDLFHELMKEAFDDETLLITCATHTTAHSFLAKEGKIYYGWHGQVSSLIELSPGENYKEEAVKVWFDNLIASNQVTLITYASFYADVEINEELRERWRKEAEVRGLKQA